MITPLVPDFMDTVKNKLSGASGIVDAIYTKNGVSYIDVRIGDEMHYKLTTSNWEVVSKYIE
jgi:hypothetical protein